MRRTARKAAPKDESERVTGGLHSSTEEDDDEAVDEEEESSLAVRESSGSACDSPSSLVSPVSVRDKLALLTQPAGTIGRCVHL